MANPTVPAWEALKRIVRYLLGHKCLAWTFVKQELQRCLVANVDSNYAGCSVTRKSTSGITIRLGTHLLRFYALTQSILALAVAESEFYAMTKGAAIILGFRSMGQDWGLTFKPQIKTDSSSAKGIVARRGASKLRHIETPFSWLQQVATRRQLEILKLLALATRRT